MTDITDRLPQLITTPILIGVASPFFLPPIPATLVSGLAAITFAPSDLAQYYRQIHESFMMMNTAIAHVKSSPCWTPEATDNWRLFRDRWVKFYSTGPSKWWTVISGDKAKADEFARGLMWWRDALANACGQEATAPVQGVVSNPFFLQPLPAADPDVQAAAQLKHDSEELARIAQQLRDQQQAEVPWSWIGATAGALGLVYWLSRRS